MRSRLAGVSAKQDPLVSQIVGMSDLQCAWVLLFHCASARPNYMRVVHPALSAGFAVRHGFIKIRMKVVNFIKKNFIKNHFHQKPLSPKKIFIKNHFHQKPLSSKNHFHQNPLSSKSTFIKNHFHQEPFSSKTTFIRTTFIKNHFHQKPFSSKTTFIKNHFHQKTPNPKDLDPKP